MDFYYQNNLNKIDFVSCLQICIYNANWSVLHFGFPSIAYDIQSNEIHLLFSNIEPRKEYFRQGLNNYLIVPCPDNHSLLIESQVDNSDYLIAFNSSESQFVFLSIFKQLLIQSNFNRNKYFKLYHQGQLQKPE